MLTTTKKKHDILCKLYENVSEAHTFQNDLISRRLWGATTTTVKGDEMR